MPKLIDRGEQLTINKLQNNEVTWDGKVRDLHAKWIVKYSSSCSFT